jgi:hypothetical protein
VNSQTPIYPQGVVKSLDLIRSSDEDGLIHVSARIVMDIEELKVLGATIGGQNPTAPPPKAITEPEPPVNSKPSFQPPLTSPVKRPPVDHNSSVHPKPEDSPTAIPAAPGSETMTKRQFATVLFWITVVAFFGLCILGLTNRVVIFSRMGDLLLTWGVVLYPFIALVFVWSFTPDNSTSEWNSTTKIALFIAIIGFGALVVRVFYSSIRENGILLGAVVAVFKLASSAIFGVFAFLGMLAYWGRAGNAGTLLYTLFGVFSGWALYKFINKDAVAGRRVEKDSALNLHGIAVELLE